MIGRKRVPLQRTDITFFRFVMTAFSELLEFEDSIDRQQELVAC